MASIMAIRRGKVIVSLELFAQIEKICQLSCRIYDDIFFEIR